MVLEAVEGGGGPGGKRVCVRVSGSVTSAHKERSLLYFCFLRGEKFASLQLNVTVVFP